MDEALGNHTKAAEPVGPPNSQTLTQREDLSRNAQDEAGYWGSGERQRGEARSCSRAAHD